MLATPIKLLCFFFVLTLAVPIIIAKETSMLLNFTPCRLSDPNLNQCIRKALNEAMTDIARGVPRLGLPPLDPLSMHSLEVSNGEGQSQIVFKFRDLDMYNLGSFAISTINFDPNSYKCFIGIEAKDNIIYKGFYEVNGYLFKLPVTGKGRCEVSMDNYKTNITIQFQKITSNGKHFLKPVNLSKTMSTSRMRFNFHNLFNGNKVLGDTVNNLMNQNWMEMLKYLEPTFTKMLDQLYIRYATAFFQKVPMDEYLQD
ncbi:protein takeout-like [Adelges cooleyi]|uniref:protein takeout-like n=1 Tax=Adelges cooleyi TaxID=133065 RepID=UPI00217F8247|nr:protein takeout-like [Adelges cooleyi]